jgi:predicted alpha/beta hydrolase family esterase
LVKAVYLAGNSYPHDRHLEDRVIALLASRLGIETIPQSQLIPQEPPLSLSPLEPAVREQTLSALVQAEDQPVILIGRSSGARTITKFAEKHPDKVVACICFAYPFQSVGRPKEDWRTKHLQTLTTPTLIIQGTRDRYGHSALTSRFDLDLHTEILYVDADHESDYLVHDWRRIGFEIEKLVLKITEQWMNTRRGVDRGSVKRHTSIPLPHGFEASIYLRLNPDVAQSGMSAQDHYRLHGAKENRPYLYA